ncbi:MAG: Nif3-like dinuclear metal center hexameric protein [Deltaproteobacteria bacterium]|nr:Nif3-like dinuclear metal center hexameric protein [Deltaproteobacteria bacterium]
MVKRNELVRYLDERLETNTVEDVSINGLQVQGRDDVRKIGLATDAVLAVYKRAKDLDCDMLIAHHGIIWGGGIRSVTGRDFEHIRFLIESGINLYAAHLPLDAHPEVGNNAELARMVELGNREPFGNYHGVMLGFKGTLPKPMTLDELAAIWQKEIGGESIGLPFGKKTINTLAVVSGGGSSALPEAIAKGIDCFVSGESRHEDHHLALEGKINVLYLGHYHSETAGVRAVGLEIAERFDVETVFIDEPTIV